ncbi:MULTISPECIES: phage tail terminator-like protein [unclassified Erwinia]|uniref:phage tail terminator-like protein n=1 Tax=unclassified Erwinia TaxID=2622719 RepID=UPI000C19407B|nr:MULTISPECIES: phage tail terminator-like protein [unclassified Erwinia]PIJ49196.1 hypothetical protein BV501_13800 [Erwinia sp. OAMSP11]PIJ79897.1 hypothetical protein BLD47_12550 [Erwinia sp. OLCASP19]PIJ81065.1 hypothetical protein BLD46_13360 [Erwinia sp. OLMTSP26]PIJ93121.1 hypothetical protein BL249_05205 [Erwinia sp. OLFS4]
MTPEITTALEAYLGDRMAASGIQVAYDNISFEPPNDEIWLQSHVLPSMPYSIDLARKCKVYPGVYQVSVIVPAQRGKSSGLSVAQHICDLFPDGQAIPADGMALYFNGEPTIYPGIQNDTSYTIPVSMTYRADVV